MGRGRLLAADWALHSEPATVHSLWVQGEYAASITSQSYLGDKVWFCGLFVHKKFRGQGIGRALFLHAVSQHPNTTLYLRPEPWGDGEVTVEQLIVFYESCGFVLQENGLMIRN